MLGAKVRGQVFLVSDPSPPPPTLSGPYGSRGTGRSQLHPIPPTPEQNQRALAQLCQVLPGGPGPSCLITPACSLSQAHPLPCGLVPDLCLSACSW